MDTYSQCLIPALWVHAQPLGSLTGSGAGGGGGELLTPLNNTPVPHCCCLGVGTPFPAPGTRARRRRAVLRSCAAFFPVPPYRPVSVAASGVWMWGPPLGPTASSSDGNDRVHSTPPTLLSLLCPNWRWRLSSLRAPVKSAGLLWLP